MKVNMKNKLSLLLAFLLLFASLQAEGLRVLYIGDSITDGNWGGGGARPSSQRNLTDMNHIYGHGFMFLCAAHYMSRYPEREYQFFNRGISGHTLDDLEKRWEEDVLALRPDVLSVLVGINDVGRYFRDEKKVQPFDFVAWEKKYRRLLDEVRRQNLELKIVLASPFLLPVGRMAEQTDYAERKQLVDRLIGIVERIAADYDAIYLPYQAMFDQLMEKHPTSQDTYWIWDGVHPTVAGHQRMADMWIKQVDKRNYLDK